MRNDRSEKGPRDNRNLNVIKVDVPRRSTKIGRPDAFFEHQKIVKKKRGLSVFHDSSALGTNHLQLGSLASKRKKTDNTGGEEVQEVPKGIIDAVKATGSKSRVRMQRQKESINHLLNALPSLSQTDLARVSASIARIYTPPPKKTPEFTQSELRPIFGKSVGQDADQNMKSEGGLGLGSILGETIRCGEPDEHQGLLIGDNQEQNYGSVEKHSHDSLQKNPSSIRMTNDRDHVSFTGSRNTEGMLAKDMLFEAHNLITNQLRQTRISLEPGKQEEDGDRLAEKLLRQAHRCLS